MNVPYPDIPQAGLFSRLPALVEAVIAGESVTVIRRCRRKAERLS
jgi:hypothetical protein